jgi:hypothetical protein
MNELNNELIFGKLHVRKNLARNVIILVVSWGRLYKKVIKVDYS